MAWCHDLCTGAAVAAMCDLVDRLGAEQAPAVNWADLAVVAALVAVQMFQIEGVKLQGIRRRIEVVRHDGLEHLRHLVEGGEVRAPLP